jgi:hypothetical protein
MRLSAFEKEEVRAYLLAGVSVEELAETYDVKMSAIRACKPRRPSCGRPNLFTRDEADVIRAYMLTNGLKPQHISKQWRVSQYCLYCILNKKGYYREE